MAIVSKRMLVFGLGMLLVSLYCMKASEASDDDSDSATIHAVRREDPPSQGCHAKNSDAGEECTDEDDHLGLYADVDDTFRAIKKGAKHLHDGHGHGHAHHAHADADDSPDIAHNNVDVLGH